MRHSLFYLRIVLNTTDISNEIRARKRILVAGILILLEVEGRGGREGETIDEYQIPEGSAVFERELMDWLTARSDSPLE